MPKSKVRKKNDFTVNAVSRTPVKVKAGPSGVWFVVLFISLMLIGLAFIAIGFLLMIGGGSTDPNKFNPEIFDFRRITLAPILILAGYVIEIFAIMKKPRD